MVPLTRWTLDWKLILVGALLMSVLGWASRWLAPGEGPAVEVPGENAAGVPLPGMTDIAFNLFGQGGNVRARVLADGYTIGPARFGIFSVTPVKEALLTNARVEVYLDSRQGDEGERSFTEALGLLDDLFIPSEPQSSRGGGGVESAGRGTRSGTSGSGQRRSRPLPRLEHLLVDVYRDQVLELRIRARDGYVDRGKGTVRLAKASIEHMQKQRRIASDAIFWDQRESRFKIPGRYVADTPQGRARGRGIAVNLDFEVSRI